jgi:L-lactate dehydrogenase complex protein LldE
MTNVLERIGCEVDFPPDQTCCGQPAFNSGFREDARTVGRHFLKVFRDCEHIVVPSGSCTAMVNHHFEDLFADDPETLAEVRAMKSRVWEFSQFLLEVAGLDDVGARCEKLVTYHDSCHALRELKIKDGPRRLLANVKGLRLQEMDKAEECCGFGGTFSVKFPDVSGSMVETKVESILRTGAEAVVSIDSSCLMQIRGALSRAGASVGAMHLAEVLDSQ